LRKMKRAGESVFGTPFYARGTPGYENSNSIQKLYDAWYLNNQFPVISNDQPPTNEQVLNVIAKLCQLKDTTVVCQDGVTRNLFAGASKTPDTNNRPHFSVFFNLFNKFAVYLNPEQYNNDNIASKIVELKKLIVPYPQPVIEEYFNTKTAEIKSAYEAVIAAIAATVGSVPPPLPPPPPVKNDAAEADRKAAEEAARKAAADKAAAEEAARKAAAAKKARKAAEDEAKRLRGIANQSKEQANTYEQKAEQLKAVAKGKQKAGGGWLSGWGSKDPMQAYDNALAAAKAAAEKAEADEQAAKTAEAAADALGGGDAGGDYEDVDMAEVGDDISMRLHDLARFLDMAKRRGNRYIDTYSTGYIVGPKHNIHSRSVEYRTHSELADVITRAKQNKEEFLSIDDIMDIID